MNLFNEAFSCFTRCTGADPGRVEGWFNLGVLYELTGARLESLAAYDKVLSLRTGSPEATTRRLQAESGSHARPEMFMFPELDVLHVFFCKEAALVNEGASRSPSVLPTGFGGSLTYFAQFMNYCAMVRADQWSEAQAAQTLSNMTAALPEKRSQTKRG